MTPFSQFLSEQSLRDKQMQQIDALIPQYIKHFDHNPIRKDREVSIQHPKYPTARLDIKRIHVRGNNHSTVALAYSRADDHPESIAGPVNHSIAFALAAMDHIHRTDLNHTFVLHPSVSNSAGRQSNSHTRLYSNLVKAINSGAYPNLSRFSGQQIESGLLFLAPRFLINKKQLVEHFLLETSLKREKFHQAVVGLIDDYARQISPLPNPNNTRQKYHDDLQLSHPTIQGVRLSIIPDGRWPNKSLANLYYNPEIHGKIGSRQMQDHVLPHVTAWALAAIKLHNHNQGPQHETYFTGGSAVHDKLYRNLIGTLQTLQPFKGSRIERSRGFPKFVLTPHIRPRIQRKQLVEHFLIERTIADTIGDLVTKHANSIDNELDLKVSRNDSTNIPHPTLAHVTTHLSNDLFGYGQTHAFLDYQHPENKPLGKQNLPDMFAHALALSAKHLEQNPQRAEVHFTGQTPTHVRLYDRLHKAFQAGHFDHHPVLGHYNMDIDNHDEEGGYDPGDEDDDDLPADPPSPTYILHRRK